MTTPPGRTRSVVSLALFAMLALSISVPAARAGVNAPPKPTELRGRMLALVNRARAGRGLATLRLNGHLSKEALAHSKDMARTGGISHTPNLVDLIRSVGGTVFGEDVARGRGLRGIYEAWLRRTDTQRVLLDPRFRRAGLGVVHVDGFYWVTLQAFD
jgi:uncharacterized protein YkwD